MDKSYLLFLGDAGDDLAVKSARGVLEWRPGSCLGQIRLEGCKADLGLPDMTLAEAAGGGARTMIIGVANAGGVIPEIWIDTIVEALDSGMDVASGMHTRLAGIAPIAEAAQRNGGQLFDARHSTRSFSVGTGSKRRGLRLLPVGTDCSCGKMYTALALEREMKQRGMAADFRATGQTGIFIAERGVSVDAVVSDFVSGATEWLTPANDADHWDLIEGQVSLFHVSYSGVSLGLLHGSQPDALVLCHDASRRFNDDFPEIELPGLEACAEANLACALIANPGVRLVGVALNTSQTDPAGVERLLDETAARLGVPCVDPVATGVAAIVDRL